MCGKITYIFIGGDTVILAIDVGNTNIVIGGFCDDSLVFVSRIASNSAITEDEYATKIQSVLSLHGVDENKIMGAIVSSVVPPLNSIIKKAISLAYGVDAILVGPGIKTGLSIHCDDPSSVGADIICACVAVKNLYGFPSLIVDMGTATKLTVIDQNGAFVGVSIVSGVGVSLKALAERAAQLPQISLEAPKTAIGKNTVDSMRSGAIFGSAAMIDGMIERFNAEMGAELPVYATGGLSQNIVPYCNHEITLDPELILKGLNILYKKNN
jgi:type III pantothenate kinase